MVATNPNFPAPPNPHRDHPAQHVVTAFHRMREGCEHYHGIKDETDDSQCTHGENDHVGSWCAMDCCPLLRERARYESVGWD